MSRAPIPENVRRMIKPRPRLSVSQWAIEKPFMIDEPGAVLRGPYDLSLTPFWREPLDSVGDPLVRWMNLVASSQIGKTLAMMIGMAWLLRHRPANAMYVRPVEDDISEAFRDRWQPMILANLRDMIPPTGEWLTVSRNPAITLQGAIIYGAAATVERQMTSRTTLIIWYDETDSAGEVANSLGNVLKVLDERQMAGSAARAITIGSSTPKYEEGSNWQAYDQRSDRREYHSPCPLCGAYQTLVSQRIRVPEKMRDPMAIRATQPAWYECGACKGAIGQEFQGWMADRGVWVPKTQKIAEKLPVQDKAIVERHSLTLAPAEERWEPRREGEASINPHRGYRVWRANAKFEQCSWSNCVAMLFETQRHPDSYQVYLNNWEALPFKESVAPADETIVRARIGELPPHVVPRRARVLLGAVDIQPDRLYYLVRAFGQQQESWLVEYGTVEVTAERFQVAMDAIYDRLFYRGWRLHGEAEEGLRMRAYALACDSGYRADEAYQFADRPGVIATKGLEQALYRVKKSTVERKHSPDPVDLYLLNTLAFKNRLQRMIRIKPGEAGEWHLHKETTEEYVRHITSEELRKKKKGAPVATWQLKAGGRDNHYLDCEAMILGLAEVLEQKGEVSLLALKETDPALGVFRVRGAGEPAPAAQTAPPLRRPAGRVPGMEGRGGPLRR